MGKMSLRFLGGKNTLLMVATSSLLMSGFGSSAWAANQKDMLILSKAVGFAERALQKEVAVVYSAASAESSNEADVVEHSLKDLGFQTRKVNVQQLSDIREGIIYVSSGLNSNWTTISNFANANKKLTVTMDDQCVENGKCVLAVRSSPSVVIKVSKNAQDSTGIHFGAAFKMMVKEY